MRRQGAWCIGAGLLCALLAAAWCWGRLSGAIGGPDERLAEILICLLPPLLLTTGVMSLLAAPNDELVAQTPRTLPVRLSSAQGEESGRSVPAIFAVTSTIAFVLAFGFVVSLFPRTWSESWECHDCSDGDGTCCDLVDASWYSWVLFAVCCIGIPLYAIGGPIAGISGLRYLRRRRQVPLPVVDVSSARLLPGARLDLRVVVHGTAPFRVLRLGVECVEEVSYRAGSSTSTDTLLAYREMLEERRDFRVPRGEPLTVARSWVVPKSAMHTFRASHSQLRWRLGIELQTRSVSLKEHYPLEILSEPDRPRP
jgi:hypothetical protein